MRVRSGEEYASIHAMPKHQVLPRSWTPVVEVRLIQGVRSGMSRAAAARYAGIAPAALARYLNDPHRRSVSFAQTLERLAVEGMQVTEILVHCTEHDDSAGPAWRLVSAGRRWPRPALDCPCRGATTEGKSGTPTMTVEPRIGIAHNRKRR